MRTKVLLIIISIILAIGIWLTAYNVIAKGQEPDEGSFYIAEIINTDDPETEALGVDYGDERPSEDLACMEYFGDYESTEDVPLESWHQKIIQKICNDYSVSYPLVLAVMEHECRFGEEYEGNIIGPMQINKNYHGARAAALECSLYDFVGNCRVGINLLGDLLCKYEGDPNRALMAYNGGSNKEKYASWVLHRALYWDSVVYGGDY